MVAIVIWIKNCIKILNTSIFLYTTLIKGTASQTIESKPAGVCDCLRIKNKKTLIFNKNRTSLFKLNSVLLPFNNNYIIGGGFKVGYTIAKNLDRGVIEVIGPFGISDFLFKTGKNISK